MFSRSRPCSPTIRSISFCRSSISCSSFATTAFCAEIFFMADALKKISAQKAVVAKLEQEMEDRQKDIDRIVGEQGRLRENMKALRGSGGGKALLQRYTRQLGDQ